MMLFSKSLMLLALFLSLSFHLFRTFVLIGICINFSTTNMCFMSFSYLALFPEIYYYLTALGI